MGPDCCCYYCFEQGGEPDLESLHPRGFLPIFFSFWWSIGTFRLFTNFFSHILTKFQVHIFCGFPAIDQAEGLNLQKETFFGQILIKD